MTSPTAATAKAPRGRPFVAYCRVSTARQGRSGLGLEAQEAAINAFLQPGDRLLAPTFVEVESGLFRDNQDGFDRQSGWWWPGADRRLGVARP